jgi:hypothetical protein
MDDTTGISKSWFYPNGPGKTLEVWPEGGIISSWCSILLVVLSSTIYPRPVNCIQ